MNNGRNFGLDIIRAIAILLVVSNHFITHLFGITFKYAWYLAYLGVDIFFVLSGFLIGGILVKNINHINYQYNFKFLKYFIFRRWLRTIPMYFIFLAFNYFLALKINNVNLNVDLWKYFFFLQNFLHYPSNFFGESWSLTIEEWFYIVFPLGLFFWIYFKGVIHQPKLNQFLMYNICFIILFNGIRLFFSQTNISIFNILIYRGDAIAYGTLAAIISKLYNLGLILKSKKIFLIACFCLLISIYIFFNAPYQPLLYLLYYPISGISIAVIILYFKYKFSNSPKHFISVCIENISKISYSLYLVNLPVIFLSLYYFRDSYLLTRIICSIFLIFGISFLTYKYIELPILKWRDKRIKL